MLKRDAAEAVEGMEKMRHTHKHNVNVNITLLKKVPLQFSLCSRFSLVTPTFVPILNKTSAFRCFLSFFEDGREDKSVTPEEVEWNEG